MALTSPFANLLQQLIIRLQTVTAVRFIAQDLGQLEFYNIRPAVSYPCCLVDIDEVNFTDLQNNKTQMGEGFIHIRTAHVKYTDMSNLTPSQYQEQALKYYEDEQAIHLALHGWLPPVDGFEPLVRRTAVTEKRDDDLRVRLLRYAVAFKDISTKPRTTKIPKPPPSINESQNGDMMLQGIGYWYIQKDFGVS